ncbi:hypothetical protein AJ80_06786 [Polytolypa hystricis UAMH7299]|uniref:Uncharacterized protein n=1 Tax=Polytolypa hystricis (strain UAMH7299) TaxID=1447883 RepID=A0A2B7XUF9_POLH7|nr:hypothetical protein AJ80_06786 [Polytolypa hystricis UAMH7299]
MQRRSIFVSIVSKWESQTNKSNKRLLRKSRPFPSPAHDPMKELIRRTYCTYQASLARVTYQEGARNESFYNSLKAIIYELNLRHYSGPILLYRQAELNAAQNLELRRTTLWSLGIYGRAMDGYHLRNVDMPVYLHIASCE